MDFRLENTYYDYPHEKQIMKMYCFSHGVLSEFVRKIIFINAIIAIFNDVDIRSADKILY